MSIFGQQEIMKSMKEMFRIEHLQYFPMSSKKHTCEETIYRMDYINFPFNRDSVRGYRGYNPDFTEDYVLNPFKFEYTNLSNKKREWITYSEIFGVDKFKLSNISELLLDGEFDSLLPITNPNESEKEEPVYTNNSYWFSDEPALFGWDKYGDDLYCEKYWCVVAQQCVLNIKKHISENVNINIDTYVANAETDNWLKSINALGFVYGCTDKYAWIQLRLNFNSIHNNECIWHPIGNPYKINIHKGVIPFIDLVFCIDKI